MRGNDHVDAGGAGHLRQPRDAPFRVFWREHHQIGQFVDDDDDIRQFFAVFVFANLFVVIGDVARADIGEHFVPVVHFAHGPLQRADHPIHIHHHRRGQMGHSVVARQFHALGINHDQFQVVGRVQQQQPGDDAVHAHRFTGAGGPGDEQMGHGRQIGGDGLAGHILPQTNGQGRLFGDFVEVFRFHHVTQGDERFGRVGHFDAHVAFAGNRRLDADGTGLQRQGQVVGQPGDFADFDFGAFPAAHVQVVGFDAELGDGGAAVDFDNGGRRAKAFQRVFDDFDIFADGRVAQILVAARFQHLRQGGQRPVVVAACGHIAHEGGAWVGDGRFGGGSSRGRGAARRGALRLLRLDSRNGGASG